MEQTNRLEVFMRKLLSSFIALLLVISLITYINNSGEYQAENNTIQERQNSNLIIYFLDVGEADSVLINSEGEYILIDAGNYLDKDNLCEYFHNLGITNFTYVIGTHPHEDHIGGIAQILRKFSVEHLLMPDIKVEYNSYQSIITEAQKKNLAIETPEIDEELIVNNSKLKVLSIGNDKTDINNSSIVIKLAYQDISALFMADAEKETELKLLDKDIKSTVLKVGHHGSGYASSAQFLKKVNPEYAIISVGKDNEYNHPREVVLNKLNTLGSKVYRTDTDGTIILLSDGERIDIKKEQTNTNGGDPKRGNKDN